MTLAACHPVEGDRILGRDLAAANPAFAGIRADAAIGFAPAAGMNRVLQSNDLTRIARTNGIDLTSRPDELCFTRSSAPISEAALRVALEKALGISGATIEILNFSRYPAPRGELLFPRAGLNAPPLANPDSPVVWRGRVIGHGGRSQPVWAKVRVTVEQTWVEAAAHLEPGKPVDAQDLRLQTARAFPYPKSSPSSIEEFTGRAPLRSIRAGVRLEPLMFTKPRDVERGQKVDVEVHSGAARLVFQGQAESAGRAGDRITVRNPENGRRFPARIESKGRVVVEAKK